MLSGLTVTMSITTSMTSNQREIEATEHIVSKAGFYLSFALPVSGTVNIQQVLAIDGGKVLSSFTGTYDLGAGTVLCAER